MPQNPHPIILKNFILSFSPSLLVSYSVDIAKILQKIVKDQFLLDFDYAIMPDLMHALKKLDIETGQQTYGDRGQLQIGIRQSEVSEKLLLLKAALWKVSVEEAAGVGWPAGMNVEAIMQ